jgi:hypothetical protein
VGRHEPRCTAHVVRDAFPLVEGKKMRPEKGNGLTAGNSQPAKTHTKRKTDFSPQSRFAGTDNARHLRVIQALMTRPLPREQLDSVAGASNGPELVAELRRRGLELECTRTKKKDRDLFDCWPGVYHFTQQDRRRVIQWLAKRSQGAGNA